MLKSSLEQQELEEYLLRAVHEAAPSSYGTKTRAAYWREGKEEGVKIIVDNPRSWKKAFVYNVIPPEELAEIQGLVKKALGTHPKEAAITLKTTPLPTIGKHLYSVEGDMSALLEHARAATREGLTEGLSKVAERIFPEGHYPLLQMEHGGTTVGGGPKIHRAVFVTKPARIGITVCPAEGLEHDPKAFEQFLKTLQRIFKGQAKVTAEQPAKIAVLCERSLAGALDGVSRHFL